MLSKQPPSSCNKNKLLRQSFNDKVITALSARRPLRVVHLFHCLQFRQNHLNFGRLMLTLPFYSDQKFYSKLQGFYLSCPIFCMVNFRQNALMGFEKYKGHLLFDSAPQSEFFFNQSADMNYDFLTRAKQRTSPNLPVDVSKFTVNPFTILFQSLQPKFCPFLHGEFS